MSTSMNDARALAAEHKSYNNEEPPNCFDCNRDTRTETIDLMMQALAGADYLNVVKVLN